MYDNTKDPTYRGNPAEALNYIKWMWIWEEVKTEPYYPGLEALRSGSLRWNCRRGERVPLLW